MSTILTHYPIVLFPNACYTSVFSAAYMELTHDQQRFTVTEVATDRQEPILKSCAWQKLCVNE